MKETQNYKEDDFKYKSFELTDQELETVSDYLNYKFKSGKTFMNCMYDLNGNLLAAQVNEESTWDLTPKEVKELFDIDAECLK